MLVRREFALGALLTFLVLTIALMLRGPLPSPPPAAMAASNPVLSNPGAHRSLTQFLMCVIALEGTHHALTPAQQKRVLPVAKNYERSVRRMGEACVRIYLTLTPAQQKRVFGQRPDVHGHAKGIFRPGVDPVIEDALRVLARREQSLPAAAPRKTPPLPGGALVNRQPLLTGIAYLEKGRYRLTPAQARFALDELRVMQAEYRQQAVWEDEIADVLTAEQQAFLRQQQTGYEEMISRETNAGHVLPVLLVRWLDAAQRP
ncbi:MAG: hypothetical protein FJX76_01810 [Armatimonadetes bacterium]|nr:hypothetical protein [Armatimonadota bacterium]